MKNTFGSIYDAIVGFVNGVQAALAIPMAAINFLRTGELGNYTIKKLPSFAELMSQQNVSQGITSARQFESQMPSPMSSGAAGETPASIPALPPKAVKAAPEVFDNTSGNAGGFETAGIGGLQGFGDIIFNVNGGDPNAVVDALRDYMRNNGSVPITTANLY